MLMKKTFTLLFLAAALTAKPQLPSTELMNLVTFPGLSNENKPDYGTKNYPIPSGAFKYITDRAKMNAQMLKLKNSYRWPTGELPDFSSRFSTRNAAGTGIIDCYTLVRPGSTDTLRLFVDPYKEESSYFVPKGLMPLTKAALAREIAPYVKLTEEIDAAPDAFALKETAAQLLQYIAQHIGVAAFTDPDLLRPALADEGADKDLRSFLMRAYIFGKFYAYAKDIPEPKAYAANKMKQSFERFTKLHPDVKTGNLTTLLK